MQQDTGKFLGAVYAHVVEACRLLDQVKPSLADEVAQDAKRNNADALHDILRNLSGSVPDPENFPELREDLTEEGQKLAWLSRAAAYVSCADPLGQDQELQRIKKSLNHRSLRGWDFRDSPKP